MNKAILSSLRKTTPVLPEGVAVLVTVARLPYADPAYGFSHWQDPPGEVSPTELFGFNILTCFGRPYGEPHSLFNLDVYREDFPYGVYFGREEMGRYSYSDVKTSDGWFFDYSYIQESDVGKTVAIYVGLTPPPRGRKSSSLKRRFYKEVA